MFSPFWQHAGFKRYFRNTAWLMAEKIVRMILAAFVGVWIARYLGPENYGVLSYVLSFVTLFSALAYLGLDGVLVKNLIDKPHDRDTLLGTGFTLRFAGALFLLFATSLAGAFFVHDQFLQLLIFIISLTAIFQSLEVIDYYFQSQVLSYYVVCVQIVQIAISTFIKIWLILQKGTLVSFALVYLLDGLIVAIGLGIIYHKRKFSILYWKLDLSLMKQLLKQSLPFFLSGAMISLYMRIDQIMVQHMLGSRFTGVYAAAINLCEIWYFIPMVICASLFPAIITAKNISPEIYSKRLQQLYDLMVLLSVLIAVPMSIFADRIVDMLLGPGYHAAGNVLRIHTWSGVFVYLGVASGKWLLAENLNHIVLQRTFCGLVINVILNLIFIPGFGIVGAAWATFFNLIVTAYFFDLFNRSTVISFKMKSESLLIWKTFLKLKHAKNIV